MFLCHRIKKGGFSSLLFCLSVGFFVFACCCAFPSSFLCVYVRACVRACVLLLACLRACVRACLRACVRACVVCVCVFNVLCVLILFVNASSKPIVSIFVFFQMESGHSAWTSDCAGRPSRQYKSSNTAEPHCSGKPWHPDVVLISTHAPSPVLKWLPLLLIASMYSYS